MQSTYLRLNLLEQGTLNFAEVINEHLQIIELFAVGISQGVINDTAGITESFKLYRFSDTATSDANSLAVKINTSTIRVIPPATGMQIVEASVAYRYDGTSWVAV